MQIHILKLRVSNAYLLAGDRPILVDTGSPGDKDAIRSKLRDVNVEFCDLALIVHTHVHSDHMGNSSEIAAEAGCPIAYHPADQAIVERSHNGFLKGVGVRGRIMNLFFSNSRFESVNADIQLTEGMALNEFGADASIITTPGHTPGSISIVTPGGDAIIGDVIMGGYVGGYLLQTKPNFHYFADDLGQAMTSLDAILSQTTGRLYVGHGGPLDSESVRKWRQRQRSGTITKR